MQSLESVLTAIEQREILPDRMFDDVDFDALLDRRDQAEFEVRWLTAFEEVNRAWREHPTMKSKQEFVDRVREAAFKRAFGASSSHHEIAATVSDDFDLICRSKLVGLSSAFIDDLENAYRSHTIAG